VSALTARAASGWPTRAAVVAVLVFLGLPLFLGLRQWDMRNDEAIYSFAVDRILETGDWLTPRSIPTDDAFLEKPPLKFWLVAGAMWLGLLPRDDFGMRAIDALFGAAAFLYVFAYGRRLAGVVGGLGSAFVLYMFEPMQLEHGIRGNNMEAAVILAYAGGMFHFVRWVESADVRRRRRHAWAVAAFFTLGFMTKFVAALFLPMIAVASLLVGPLSIASRGARANVVRFVLDRWRDWLWPVALALLTIVPWFAYQIVHTGPDFWRIIFGQHVYERFTASLDPSHLFPWHHYFTHTWREFEYAGIRWICAAGLVALVIHALRGQWLARVALVWWLLPFLLMSFGTSKLYHYAYPFLAPLAIGAGAAASWLIGIAFQPQPLLGSGGGRPIVSLQPRTARILMWVGTLAVVIAAATAYFGPVQFEVAGVRLFSNSSVMRPAIAGALCWIIAGRLDLLLTVAAVVMFVALMPFGLYPKRLERLHIPDYPIRATRDCAQSVQDRKSGV
jgi:4-amino-4-deoxy-L-arabinose transferase-like glycosyltransferase